MSAILRDFLASTMEFMTDNIVLATEERCNKDTDRPIELQCEPKMTTEEEGILQILPESTLRLALINDGFVHLPRVLSDQECDQALARMWDFVEDTSYGLVRRNDPDSWYKSRETSLASQDPWPINIGASFSFDANGAGWLLGNEREILAERAFGPLFGTLELHCSKEGFIFRRPPRKPDQEHSGESTICISSDDKYQAVYIRSLVAVETQTFQVASGASQQLCRMQQGDVLLFRSDVRLDEFAEATEATLSPQFCAAFCCTMHPSRFTPQHVLERKFEAYRLRSTGDYRPDAEECGAPSESCRCTRPFFRTSPPLVTIRQAELYGLLSYSDNDLQQERALVQGVRFAPELMPTRPSTRQCSARLDYLWTKECDEAEMVGQDKYLGGMASPCGRYVYGVPGSAKRVMRIHCETGEIDFIGPQLAGKFKWLRGVEVPAEVMDDSHFPDGCCFALPCNASSILKVNPHDSHVSTFGHDVLSACGAANGWLYHGGNLAANGWIYAIPANAARVLKFHPVTDECLLIGPDFGGSLQKWYGGILGGDGCIYGIPHNERAVLKINPVTDEVTVMMNKNCSSLPDGEWKWHGGLRAGDKIIGFPNNADNVLVINVPEHSVYTISMKDEAGTAVPLRSGRHRVYKGINKYKYLGGSLTADERYAYLFPCDAEQVLRIDLHTEELSLIGPLLLEGPNKWQNGFTAGDGCCYGAPQRATGILRITPAALTDMGEDHVDIMDCGPISGVKDKFEGGVMATDGKIYCIPLRAKACVRILPATDCDGSTGR